MKVAILAIGTELLFGHTVNTNGTFLSQQLNLLGFDVLYHLTSGDNPGRMRKLIDFAFEECDMVITTGGLGPTEDDITKEILCEAMGDTLVEDIESKSLIEDYFAKMNRPMTSNNLKQALMPSNAKVLKNPKGTAPGFFLEKDGKYGIALPGPPREMKSMYLESLLPLLEPLCEDTLFHKTARVFGIGESAIEDILIDLVHGKTNPTVATYAKEGECTVRLASKNKNPNAAKNSVNEVMDLLKERLGKHLYSTEDVELHRVVGQKLIDNSISISSAESCTGGMFAERLSSISGISKVFDRSFVTYSKEAKMEVLGVKEATIDEFSLVSPQVAEEMARGLKAATNSDISVAVTGLAGPTGDGVNPVGLIYVAVLYKDNLKIEKLQMRSGDRDWNRKYVVLKMLFTVNEAIDETLK